MKREDFVELRILVREASRQRTLVSSMCEGKEKFPSKRMAERAVRKGKPVCTFHCIACGAWHVGGIKTKREKRLSIKRRRNECEFA